MMISLKGLAKQCPEFVLSKLEESAFKDWCPFLIFLFLLTIVIIFVFIFTRLFSLFYNNTLFEFLS